MRRGLRRGGLRYRYLRVWPERTPPRSISCHHAKIRLHARSGTGLSPAHVLHRTVAKREAMREVNPWTQPSLAHRKGPKHPLKGPRTWAPVGTPRAPCSPPHTGVIGATTCVLGVLRTRTAGRGATVRTGNPAARRSHLTALPLSQSHLRRTRRGSPSPQSDCNRREQQHARGRETPLHPYHERHRCRAARAPVS